MLTSSLVRALWHGLDVPQVWDIWGGFISLTSIPDISTALMRLGLGYKKICLKSNNCQFDNNNYVQQHGTAMGPKNACSYADLAMGVIDHKARFEGTIKPMLWLRYRDDIFDLWTQGVEKLLEFTNYINSLYHTIKFELVYSESSLNVLDLTLLLQDGFISTDTYSKPTDSHLYLPYNSSHPDHCKKAIPYGVALRIRRNCSTNASFVKRCSEYKSYLK